MAGITNVNHHGFKDDAGEAVVAFLVGLLLLAGSAFVYTGLGLDLGLLDRVASRPDALLIGLGLWVLAVLTAKFSIFGTGQERTGSRSASGRHPRPDSMRQPQSGSPKTGLPNPEPRHGKKAA
jgi:hypothetical protein